MKTQTSKTPGALASAPCSATIELEINESISKTGKIVLEGDDLQEFLKLKAEGGDLCWFFKVLLDERGYDPEITSDDGVNHTDVARWTLLPNVRMSDGL